MTFEVLERRGGASRRGGDAGTKGKREKRNVKDEEEGKIEQWKTGAKEEEGA